MTFKEKTGYDTIFDLAKAMHQQAADLFADGDRERVEIHCIDGETSVIVDGVRIDWQKRLESDLYGMLQGVTQDAYNAIQEMRRDETHSIP